MSRLNLSIEPKLRTILERIAKLEGKSLTELINSRLEASLTPAERFGEVPDWLKQRIEKNPQDFFDSITLPEPLQKIQDAIDNLEKIKSTLEDLYDNEVKTML